MLAEGPRTGRTARARLELLWLRVGLVVATLLCCVAPPEATAALLVAASADDSAQALVEVETELEGERCPQWRHRDSSPSGPADPRVLALETETETETEAETETETDASAGFDALALDLGLRLEASMRRLARLEPCSAAECGQLLVSTGLGRGPPTV